MTGSEVFQLLSAVGSLATAAAAVVAAIQLLLSKRQAQSQFEDALSREYRQLASALPLEALLGESVDEATYQAALPVFYRYFDLSNEQAFLRHEGRVSRATWCQWRDGIQSNMMRPSFQRAWKEVKSRSRGDFGELRILASQGFLGDPRDQQEDSPTAPRRASYDENGLPSSPQRAA